MLLDTISGIGALARRMDSTLGTASDEAPAPTYYRPRTEVRASDSGFTLTVDVPGVRRDALEVKVESRSLSVRGLRSDGRTGWAARYTVPDGYDPEGIAARVEDGVLNIEVPRSDAHRPRLIEVR